ncbi:hypothetical protein P3T39_007298, partial [Kitasatospora sp. GP82]|nr:hypothetical protein [Kitasatospora sp. GP82]
MTPGHSEPLDRSGSTRPWKGGTTMFDIIEDGDYS